MQKHARMQWRVHIVVPFFTHDIYMVKEIPRNLMKQGHEPIMVLEMAGGWQ